MDILQKRDPARPGMRRHLFLCLAALLTGGATPIPPMPAWTRPTPPFHVVGPIYYVGTEGLAAYLVSTRAGLILLDGTLEENVPSIERNIAALGFRLTDVKLLLVTHAHFDHAAGLARLKRDTGADLVASAGDRPALESGLPPSDSNYEEGRFAPVKVDRVLTDRRPVRLGDVAMTPVVTPGHTPGCTTWTMLVTEAGRPLRIVFPCSGMSAAGNKLLGNKGYPGVVGDFRRAFARMRRLHADVVLPPHPELADVIGRARRRDAGDSDAFLAPDMLPKMVDQAEAAFNAELMKARAGTGGKP